MSQMEGVGEAVIVPPTDSDFSAVGSPEEIIADPYTGELPQAPDELHPPPITATPALTDELRDQIIKQVEYYFSDENLRTDNFLLKYLTKDEEGYVPVAVIASFRKMKKLTRHGSLVVAAIKESSLLVLSPDEKNVKRLNPFPLTEVLDRELCTVLVENLPEDHTTENMKRIFGEAGIIKKITIHEENARREPRKCSIEEKLLCGKLHAVVEYETIEAAENAAATLNNEQDWRHGMRVKLLKKRGKTVQRKKGHESEKKSSVQVDPPGDQENLQSSEHQVDTPNEETGEHPSKEKNGNKGQNRRRSRKQKYHGPSGLGHGTSAPQNYTSEFSKPPPGPRMPDGTRGFTMGRGRPLAADQN